MNILKRLFERTEENLLHPDTAFLFHPESSGVRIKVRRNWWQRLVRPKHFATPAEVQAARTLSERINVYGTRTGRISCSEPNHELSNKPRPAGLVGEVSNENV